MLLGFVSVGSGHLEGLKMWHLLVIIIATSTLESCRHYHALLPNCVFIQLSIFCQNHICNCVGTDHIACSRIFRRVVVFFP